MCLDCHSSGGQLTLQVARSLINQRRAFTVAHPDILLFNVFVDVRHEYYGNRGSIRSFQKLLMVFGCFCNQPRTFLYQIKRFVCRSIGFIGLP